MPERLSIEINPEASNIPPTEEKTRADLFAVKKEIAEMGSKDTALLEREAQDMKSLMATINTLRTGKAVIKDKEQVNEDWMFPILGDKLIKVLNNPELMEYMTQALNSAGLEFGRFYRVEDFAGTIEALDKWMKDPSKQNMIQLIEKLEE